MLHISQSISQSKSPATPMFNRADSIIFLQEEEVNHYEQLYNLPQTPLDLAIGKSLVAFEKNLTGDLGSNNNYNLVITCYRPHTVVSALHLLSNLILVMGCMLMSPSNSCTET